MPTWVNAVFLQLLPQILMRRRPLDKRKGTRYDKNPKGFSGRPAKVKFNHRREPKLLKECCHCRKSGEIATSKRRLSHQPLQWMIENLEPSPEVEDVIDSVQFIAENMRNQNETKEVNVCLF